MSRLNDYMNYQFVSKKTLAEAKMIGNVTRKKPLHSKRSGYLFLFGEVLDDWVKEYAKNWREIGAVINLTILVAVAEEIKVIKIIFLHTMVDMLM